MKIILLYIIFAVIGINLNAEWSSVSQDDAFTDKHIDIIIYEDDEHKIQLQSADWLILTRKKQGFIDQNADITIRVDKNKVYKTNIAVIKDMHKIIKEDVSKVLKYDDKTIAFSFLMLTGELLKYLKCEMLRGDFLNIRYGTNSLYYEDIKIPLKGIDKIFCQVYGKKGIPYTDCK